MLFQVVCLVVEGEPAFTHGAQRESQAVDGLELGAPAGETSSAKPAPRSP
jgi:hypothetical protein